MYEGDPPRVSEERLSHLYWAGQHGITDDELRHPSMLEDEFLEKCKDVKRLELFMYSTMSAEDLGDFVNLQELSIQLQTVPRAVGLRRLVKLQRLSITDCGLESVAGVEACVQLRHLDVSQNRIEEMDPNVLQYLEELRTLQEGDGVLLKHGIAKNDPFGAYFAATPSFLAFRPGDERCACRALAEMELEGPNLFKDFSRCCEALFKAAADDEWIVRYAAAFGLEQRFCQNSTDTGLRTQAIAHLEQLCSNSEAVKVVQQRAKLALQRLQAE